MVRRLIQWSLDNPLIVLLLTAGLIVVGVYSFLHVNVEAYPDPAPPTVEVVTLFPVGSFREEVERQVTAAGGGNGRNVGLGIHAQQDGLRVERHQNPFQL